jgi:hypothetical protein
LYLESYGNNLSFSQSFTNNSGSIPVFIDAETYGIRESYISKSTAVGSGGESLLIHSALQVYTKPSNQIQFYTGVGLGLGLALNNRVVFAEKNLHTIETAIYNYGSTFPVSRTNELILDEYKRFDSEVFNTLISQLYFPMGTRLRLGTTNKFWSRMYLGTELWTTFALDYTKEFGTKGRFGMLSNFSLSYQFGQ